MMKRFFLLTALAVLSLGSALAQTPVKYQGEVDLGYSLGVGNFGINRANLHTIHGAKIGQYFSAGIGLGLDYYHEDGASEAMLPIYLNLKGYLPVNEKVSPYFSFDIGGGFGITEGFDGASGMLVTPAVGIKAGKFKAQIGYNVQKISESGVSINLNAIQFKVGVIF